MVRLKLCRTRFHIHPLIILLICCFSTCRSSRHSFLFPFFKGLKSIGETKRLETAENRMSTDENHLQKIDPNNNYQFFKPYRARDTLSRLSSIFEHNPFARNRPKARSLNSTPKINPLFKSHTDEIRRGLKPPNVIITPRNKTYLQQLLNSKQLPDDEHPILIKNNHGKLSDFVKPVTLSDLVNSMITSRTTTSLLNIFNNDKNTSTSKRATTSKEISSKETSTSSEDMRTITQPTVFDDEMDIYHKVANNLNYTSLIVTKDDDKMWNASSNIVKPIRDWNHHNLNHHLAHNSDMNLIDNLNLASDESFAVTKYTTSSSTIDYRQTNSPSHKHTTLLSPHRTPAHVIITKKGNYTTNNSSKYFVTPSYILEKKKPMRFSLKPIVISSDDDRKQQTYTESDNPIKVNSYEDLDFVYSTTAMPMDSYENGLNIKHPEHPQLIVHSSQHLKNPFHSKTNVSLSAGSTSQRNNTKIANISKWPLKQTINKTIPQHNFTKVGHQNSIYQSLMANSSLPLSASSEEDESFTQLQSQHQASNKIPFHNHTQNYNYLNSVTQRPTLQVTQLNAIYTKPDSDLVHSEITVIDHDNSEQSQSTQSNQQTSTTIMHKNLVVSYKPGRPLPGEHQNLITTTPSYTNLQQSNEQISQGNILKNQNNVKHKPDQSRIPLSPGSGTKTNFTLTKLPSPIKYNQNKINNASNNDQKTSQQQSVSSLQPPRRVGILPFSQQISQQTQHEQQHIYQQQIISSNHTSSNSSNNSTSGHKPHRHQNGYVNAIFAPPMPSRLSSTSSPSLQIVKRNPLLAWLGVDSLSQLLDRSFLFRTFVVILTILLLPPLTVVAAITSIG